MFYKVYDWMLFDRNLTANELKLFMMINTFTEMNGKAQLSYSVMEKMMSRGLIKKTLDSLIEKKLIIKIKTSVYKSIKSDTNLEKTESTESDTNFPKKSTESDTKKVPKVTHRKNKKKKEKEKEEKPFPSREEFSPADAVPTERKTKFQTLDPKSKEYQDLIDNLNF